MDSSHTKVAKTAKICLNCRKQFPGELAECPDDGGQLVEDKPDPLLGTIFADKYEVLSVLGQGGMSVVYKARHKHMHRIVALKLLLEELGKDESAFKRFEQESRAAASLSHQNIVSVHDFGITEKGQAYFVMDCLEGDSLEDLIFRDGYVPADRAVSIFSQVCEGLQHAHKKGIIHRDLKPSNIVLLKEEDGTETPKIVDFGIAKMGDADTRKSSRLTQTGQVFGSPLYMSPEQCQGMPLDSRSDLYSLGCLMYETLTGQCPFSADSFFNMALQHLQQPPPPFSELAPDIKIPKAVEEVVLKCLEKKPEDRFGSAESVKQKLHEAALVAGLPGYKPGAVPATKANKTDGFRHTWEKMKAVVEREVVPTQQKKRSPMARLATIGGAVTMFVALAFFFLFPGVQGDMGTPAAKTWWQICMWAGNRSLDSNHLDLADIAYNQASYTARRCLQDGQEKLRKTLTRQKELYHVRNQPDKEGAIDAEIEQIAVSHLLTDESRVRDELSQLLSAQSSGPGFGMQQLHAGTVAREAHDIAMQLMSKSYFDHAESLLKQSLQMLKHMQLQSSDDMARAELVLAIDLQQEQRLDEIRPLLVDAVAIRKRAVAGNDHDKKMMATYVKTLLKLGDFDRDQSSFDKAQAELSEALSVVENKIPDAPRLLTSCLNSKAELERQLHHAEECERLLGRARDVSKMFRQHAPQYSVVSVE